MKTIIEYRADKARARRAELQRAINAKMEKIRQIRESIDRDREELTATYDVEGPYQRQRQKPPSDEKMAFGND